MMHSQLLSISSPLRRQGHSDFRVHTGLAVGGQSHWVPAYAGTTKWWRIIAVHHKSSSQSPAVAQMQVCTMLPASFMTLPVRKSRTQPEISFVLQVWQMPMRQPCGGFMPASSATRSKLVLALACASIPLLEKRTRPPKASAGTGASSARKRSMCKCRVSPACSYCFSSAATSGCGPQA